MPMIIIAPGAEGLGMLAKKAGKKKPKKGRELDRFIRKKGDGDDTSFVPPTAENDR